MKRLRGRPASPLSPTPRNLRELAGRLGCSYQTAVNLRRNGLIHVEDDGTYDVEKCTRAAQAKAATGKAGSVRVSVAEQDSPITNEARKWDTEYRKAKALREIFELKKVQKDLVFCADVCQAWGMRIRHFKDALLTLGRELGHKCVGKSARDISELIDKRIIEILNLMAHQEFKSDGKT